MKIRNITQYINRKLLSPVDHQINRYLKIGDRLSEKLLGNFSGLSDIPHITQDSVAAMGRWLVLRNNKESQPINLQMVETRGPEDSGIPETQAQLLSSPVSPPSIGTKTSNAINKFLKAYRPIPLAKKTLRGTIKILATGLGVGAGHLLPERLFFNLSNIVQTWVNGPTRFAYPPPFNLSFETFYLISDVLAGGISGVLILAPLLYFTSPKRTLSKLRKLINLETRGPILDYMKNELPVEDQQLLIDYIPELAEEQEKSDTIPENTPPPTEPVLSTPPAEGPRGKIQELEARLAQARAVKAQEQTAEIQLLKEQLAGVQNALRKVTDQGRILEAELEIFFGPQQTWLQEALDPSSPLGQIDLSLRRSIGRTLDPNTIKDPAVNLAFGQYQVIRRLGEGAMGEVFLASKNPNDFNEKLVIIKTLKDRQHLARFAREAQILQEINDPRIMRVYEFQASPTTPTPYLVGEYIPGGLNLETLKQRSGKIPLEQVLRLMHAVASALKVITEQGIVHRDIKPENVMVTLGREVIKLVDFGIAKNTQETIGKLTMNNVIGTLNYLAPEARDNNILTKGLDHRADIYALGIMAYELATGAVPFAPLGNNVAEMLAGHEQFAIDPANTFSQAMLQHLSADSRVQTLFRRIGEKNRDNRISSYDEIMQTIEDILASPA